MIGKRTLKILHINTELTWRGGEQQALYLMEGFKSARADVAFNLSAQ